MLLRLAAGSSLGGLAAMRPSACSYHADSNHQCRVIRPLLTLSKAELVNYCLEQHVSWVEDPSNQSLTYTRNRVRLALEQLAAGGLDIDSLHAALGELELTRQELDTMAQGFVQQHCRLKQSFIEVEWKALQALSEAGQHHVISGLISLISGGRIAQDKQLTRVLSGLDAKGRVDVCVHERDGNGPLQLYRASMESHVRSQPLTPTAAVTAILAPEFSADATCRTVVWDHRLNVTIQAKSQQALDAFCSHHQLTPLTKKQQVRIFQAVHPRAREVLKRLKPVRRDASVALTTTATTQEEAHVLYAGMKPLRLSEDGVVVTCTRKPEFVFGKLWQLR